MITLKTQNTQTNIYYYINDVYTACFYKKYGTLVCIPIGHYPHMTVSINGTNTLQRAIRYMIHRKNRYEKIFI
jgi:hypothetical protein